MDALFLEYAAKIWANDSSAASDRARWHTSGYHIRRGEITLEGALEDAHEMLDIIPEQCGIDVQTEEWQEKYLDDPRMIAAMAKVAYAHLRKHDRYAFSGEQDWSVAAESYLKELRS